MDRVAVLVDAGYFFAAGSALVSGQAQQRREQIVLDELAAVNAFKHLATKLSGGLPLLRIYWYDGAPRRTGPSAEHLRLAACDDIKLRLGFINATGQQKGVDSLIVTDLVELARNRSVCDVVLLSGDEDVRIGVQLAQSFGSRVHLVGIKPSAGTQSADLRHEADTCTELQATDIGAIIKLRAAPAPIAAAAAPKQVKPKAAGTGATPAAAAPAAPAAAAAAAATPNGAFDAVIETTLSALNSTELLGVAKYINENSKNIPGEIDGRILARCRVAAGGNFLDDASRRYVRNKARQRVLDLAAKIKK